MVTLAIRPQFYLPDPYKGLPPTLNHPPNTSTQTTLTTQSTKAPSRKSKVVKHTQSPVSSYFKPFCHSDQLFTSVVSSRRECCLTFKLHLMFALKHFQFFGLNIFLNSIFQSISLNLKKFQHSQTTESRLPLIPFLLFFHEILIH